MLAVASAVARIASAHSSAVRGSVSASADGAVEVWSSCHRAARSATFRGLRARFGCSARHAWRAAFRRVQLQPESSRCGTGLGWPPQQGSAVPRAPSPAVGAVAAGPGRKGCSANAASRSSSWSASAINALSPPLTPPHTSQGTCDASGSASPATAGVASAHVAPFAPSCPLLPARSARGPERCRSRAERLWRGSLRLGTGHRSSEHGGGGRRSIGRSWRSLSPVRSGQPRDRVVTLALVCARFRHQSERAGRGDQASEAPRSAQSRRVRAERRRTHRWRPEGPS